MKATNEFIVQTLEQNFNMKVYHQRMTNPEQTDFNYFIYTEQGLRKTSSCKFMQVVMIRAVLDPVIPVNFEFDVIEKMEEIGLFLSNGDEVEYGLGFKGSTDDTIINLIDFTFLRPFKRESE